MKIKALVSLLLLAAPLLCCPDASAQGGLGGFIRKAKNATEKIAGSEKSAVNVVAGGQDAANPIGQFMMVEPIGLYGVSQTEHTGNLYLVLRVVNKTEKSSATFGSSIKNQKMIAVDNDGLVYNIDSSGAFRYDTPQDVPVKIELKDPGLQFVNVSKALGMMSVVKIGINIDANRQGNLTFNNVPIFWDVYPE